MSKQTDREDIERAMQQYKGNIIIQPKELCLREEETRFKFNSAIKGVEPLGYQSMRSQRNGKQRSSKVGNKYMEYRKSKKFNAVGKAIQFEKAKKHEKLTII